MKKFLLITLVFGFLGCKKEEVKPLSVSNKATIKIESEATYALAVTYLMKDKWLAEEPYIYDSVITGPIEISVDIEKNQNFMYAVQVQNEVGNTLSRDVSARLIFRDQDKTKSFDGKGMLYDIYEFYPQAY